MPPRDNDPENVGPSVFRLRRLADELEAEGRGDLAQIVRRAADALEAEVERGQDPAGD